MENRINKFHKRCLRLAFDELQDLSFSYLLLKDKNVNHTPRKSSKPHYKAKQEILRELILDLFLFLE